MDSPSKRIFTEAGRESASTTDQSVLATGAASEQLALSLRNVGARVRYNVSQGYRGPPTDFVKAQSTGTIFRSMNDTIRHAHSNLSTPYGQNRDSSKKRSRSVESDEQDGGQEAESGCLAHSSSNLHATTAATRPTKPLRFSKSKFVRPPSLPTGSSSFADPRHMTETKEVAEEEDWSLNMSSEATEQRFEAMEVD